MSLTVFRRPLLSSGAVPKWVLPGFAGGVDAYFSKGLYYGMNAPPAGLTTSRASVGYANDQAGNWYQFGNNVPRITNLGLKVEESRTNSALWSRDMTNAAWTKTNVSAALTAPGILNDAHAASTLTASAGNGTVLQSVTLATGNSYSVFVKRLTGSGEIDITGNGGTGWTNIASLINSSTWTRVNITNQAVTNPSIGFRIVTNGDAIVVDVNQLELGASVTTPIPTTNAAATRNADGITLAKPPTFGNAYTLFAAGTPDAPTGYGNNQFILNIDDNTNSNRVGIRRAGVSGNIVAYVEVAGVETDITFGVLAPGVLGKAAISAASGNQQAAFNGTGGSSSGSIAAGSTFLTTWIGQHQINALQFNGTISRIAVAPTAALSATQLQAITNLSQFN